MSTVTLDIPDDLDDELEELLEENPQFNDIEDLLLTMLRVVSEGDRATANIQHASDAFDRDEPEQAIEALEEALESNQRAHRAMLDVFGVEPALSEEAQEMVRKSERDFEQGNYVPLEDV